MIVSRKVNRYYAPCGAGFWKKKSAITHEAICKCWTNPKLRCCKSCAHYYRGYDPDDYSTGYRGEGYINECRVDVEYGGPLWKPAHSTKAIDLNIHCIKWEALNTASNNRMTKCG